MKKFDQFLQNHPAIETIIVGVGIGLGAAAVTLVALKAMGAIPASEPTPEQLNEWNADWRDGYLEGFNQARLEQR